MKKLSKFVLACEAVLIVLMSTVASFSLLESDITTYPVILGLVLVGGLTIIWKYWQPELFSVLVFAVAFPALLKHNGVNILDTLNGKWPGADTSFAEALGLGMIIILGYLLLKSMNAIQIEYKELTEGQAEKNETLIVTTDKLMATTLFVFFCGIISLLIALISKAVTSKVSGALTGFTGGAIAIGLGIMLLLAAALYWLGRTLKSKQ